MATRKKAARKTVRKKAHRPITKSKSLKDVTHSKEYNEVVKGINQIKNHEIIKRIEKALEDLEVLLSTEGTKVKKGTSRLINKAKKTVKSKVKSIRKKPKAKGTVKRKSSVKRKSKSTRSKKRK